MHHCTASRPTSEPLELIHLDLNGPWNTPSLHQSQAGEIEPISTGSKYCLVLVDDLQAIPGCTSMPTRINFTKRLHISKRWWKQTGRKVKRMQSDQALEFHSREVTELAKRYSIILEASPIYAREQNEKAERMNKTLIDMARTTMIGSCLPEASWAEALRIACHVRNRMVSRTPRSDKPTTPFEAYHGRKPEVQYMRPFGCLTYVTRPHELRRKCLSRTAAYEAIMLGYTKSTYQYRVWNIRAGYIQLVHDTTFNERSFPAASIGAYKNIFPLKPLPEALLANINNNTSLDTCTRGNGPAIEPSLEPGNNININRQQDANATAQIPTC